MVRREVGMGDGVSSLFSASVLGLVVLSGVTVAVLAWEGGGGEVWAGKVDGMVVVRAEEQVTCASSNLPSSSASLIRSWRPCSRRFANSACLLARSLCLSLASFSAVALVSEMARFLDRS